LSSNQSSPRSVEWFITLPLGHLGVENTASSDLETLVFLHGFGGGSSAYEWSKVYPAFAAEYRSAGLDRLVARSIQHGITRLTTSTITEFLSKPVVVR